MNKEKLQSLAEKNHGASRRKKAFIKEQLETLLLLDLPECKLKEDMRKIGIVEADMSVQLAMLVMLVKQAISGNLKAFTLIRDQIDQNPKDGVIEPLQNIYFINDISSKSKEKKEAE